MQQIAHRLDFYVGHMIVARFMTLEIEDVKAIVSSTPKGVFVNHETVIVNVG